MENWRMRREIWNLCAQIIVVFWDEIFLILQFETNETEEETEMRWDLGESGKSNNFFSLICILIKLLTTVGDEKV